MTGACFLLPGGRLHNLTWAYPPEGPTSRAGSQGFNARLGGGRHRISCNVVSACALVTLTRVRAALSAAFSFLFGVLSALRTPPDAGAEPRPRLQAQSCSLSWGRGRPHGVTPTVCFSVAGDSAL